MFVEFSSFAFCITNINLNFSLVLASFLEKQQQSLSVYSNFSLLLLIYSDKVQTADQGAKMIKCF